MKEPKSDYFIAIHVKTRIGGSNGGRINDPCVLTSYCNGDAGWGRFLDNLGVDHHFVLKRPVSETEYKEKSHRYRMEVWKYDNWKALIEEEKELTTDKDYLFALWQLQFKYPQFKKP